MRTTLVALIATLALTTAPGSAEPRAYEKGLEAAPGLVEGRVAPEGEDSQTTPQIGPRTNGTSFFGLGVAGRGSSLSYVKTINFQLDLEYDLFRYEGDDSNGYYYLTMPFQLLAFWDLFNQLPGSTSAPFWEIDYQPGLEVSWVAPLSLISYWSIRVGARHQSNGLGSVTIGEDDVRIISSSRSWNQLYAGSTLTVYNKRPWAVTLDGEGWVPFKSADIQGWEAKLENHIGYFLIGTRIRLNLGPYNDWIVRLYGSNTRANMEARWSLKKAATLGSEKTWRFDIMARAHHGKGLGMIYADETPTVIWTGIGF